MLRLLLGMGIHGKRHIARLKALRAKELALLQWMRDHGLGA